MNRAPYTDIATLKSRLQAVLGERARQFIEHRGQLTLVVNAADYLGVARELHDHADLAFEVLIDLCGVDYSTWKDMPWDGPRYAVVTHLLSIKHNCRLRLRVAPTDDDWPVVDSLTAVWSAANWFEREAFDLYGLIFEGHNDLRRILTDYGFIGHPMRKDFPLTGHVEMIYDEENRRVKYQSVTIDPREITPRVVREDRYGGLH
ncbi:NADH-quinone oxidoreductase subunit C [Amphibiibacter pelophylacis]|uniref:NADH-quinone oxidoreductase subunit C n=1 Tax=Amphibiibacter pelophylacis TaxID=1799477 RepID=A0ACC6P0L5_9BURK